MSGCAKACFFIPRVRTGESERASPVGCTNSTRRDETPELQASEGTLYSGVAATDQVAEPANRAFALELNRPNLRASLEALQRRRLEAEIARLISVLHRWRRNRSVREV